MKYFQTTGLSILLALGLSMMVSCTRGDIGAEEKLKVQGAMKEFVDEKLLQDKNVYRIEDKTGVFDYLHEGVKRKGDMYVSCADVKVGNDVYDIDYYVKRENDNYTVKKEILHKINKKEINRTLWEEE